VTRPPRRRGGATEEHVARHRTDAGQTGFSLLEMLVASAIFAIAAAVAFILYTAAQKSYKSGENFTDQQQSTRVAFDRMVSDIRLAGYNHNPDGDSSRVDEQIEGAWDTAIAFRADLDFEDPAASASPESLLAGTVYNVVSTGNDEIITYALAKPGPAGSGSLTVRIDPDRPRSKAVKTITIPNVAVVQDSPPYTLYRITLKDVAGSFPSPGGASDFVYEPVAENIRTMTFQYYDDQGTMLNPNTPANAADDIGGADANNLARSRIRRIKVNVVGMTRDEDLGYTDVSDASATLHYRKFDLASDVNPENLGKTGIQDIDIIPPPSPTGVALVPGHCAGMLVKWDKPSVTSGVTSYLVKYWPQASPSSFSTAGFTYPHVEYGVIDDDGHGFVAGLTDGTSYCFQVQARDAVGNQSGWAPASSPPCATVTNVSSGQVSTPGTVQNVAATYYPDTTGMPAEHDGRIKVSWDELKVNSATTPVTGDPDTIGGATILRDLAGYKLYRSDNASFTPNAAVKTVTDLPIGTHETLDAVSACKDYFYKVVGVDTCGVEGAMSAMVTGRANTVYSPAAPGGVSASRTDRDWIRVSWSQVTQNTASPAQTILVEKYNIYRAVGSASLSPEDPSLNYIFIAETTPSTPLTPYYDDYVNAIRTQLKTNAAFYKVTALDYCPHESARSSGAKASCVFSGTLSYSPSANGSGAGDVPIALSVVGGTDSFYDGTVKITRNSDGAIVYNELRRLPSSFPTWTDPGVNGFYTIFFEVENNKGCIATAQVQWERTNNLPCRLSASTPATLTPTTGALQKNILSYTLTNTYTKDLEITQITASWTSPGTERLNEVQLPTGVIYCGPVSLTSGQSCTASFLPPIITTGGSAGTKNTWSATMGGKAFTMKYDFKESVLTGTPLTGSCTFCISSGLAVTTSATGTCP
jgi:prepilin-type N-terminal cleavage/methylation domain-containing protein